MKTIIVPTDFSVYSVNAAHYASDMAAAIGAEIILMHVVTMPVTISEVPVPVIDFELMIDDAKVEIEKTRKSLSEYAHDKVKISTVVTLGRVVDELDKLANEVDLFAVIMGMQGAGAIERSVFGSNALSVMLHLSCPAIIVPHGLQYNKIEKIGLTSDLHNVLQDVPVARIENLVSLFAARLDILYVNKASSIPDPQMLAASAMLQEGFSGLQPQVHFIKNDRVEDGITEFVTAARIDLLLIVPHKHGFIGLLFHSSISKKIALDCNVPVMSLH